MNNKGMAFLLVAAAMFLTAVQFTSAQSAPPAPPADILKSHVPNAEIDARAKDLALKLLDGQPSFLKDWNDYLSVLRKGPNAQQNEAELAMDMYQKDPQDVTVDISPDGRLHNYSVDTWRISVNNSVLQLSNASNVAETISSIEKSVNANVVAGSKDLYVADLNRDCVRYKLPYTASRDSSGNIHISKHP